MVWGGQHFFHDLMRKYIVVFGKTFDNTTITRESSNGSPSTAVIKVPLEYAPKDKMFVRLTSDPNLDRPDASLLPRMSFAISGGLKYDGQRQLTSTGRDVQRNAANVNNFHTLYNPIPFDIPIDLYIYAKFQQDSNKILEQILPFFTPEFTPTVELIPDMNLRRDIPIIMGSPSLQDTFDGKFPDRRLLIWTIPFTMKAYFYGPIIDRPMIKFVKTNVYADRQYSHIGIGAPLSAYCNSTQTTISLYNSGIAGSLPQTGNSDPSTHYLAQIDQEFVRVTGGFGTNTLTVERQTLVSNVVNIANGHSPGALLFGVNEGNYAEYIITQPGLLANGAPTNSVNNSISYTLIDVDDDFGYASQINVVGAGD